MQLSALVAASADVAATRSRKAKVARLAELLAELTPPQAVAGVSLLAGKLPGGRIGVGWAALRELPQPATSPGLRLEDLIVVLERIRATSGPGAARERREQLSGLLSRATAAEQGFLRRLLLGELRQGALEALVVEALALTTKLPLEDVRRAVMLAGTLGPVAEAALGEGAAGLGRFRLELGRAVQPMLAQKAEDPLDALRRLGRAGFEVKLDGARLQLHKHGDRLWAFTRRGHDVTDRLPELSDLAPRLAAGQLIADGEAIALRPDGRPRPFQETMRRIGRKRDVAALRDELPIRVFLFDCLHLDGDDLLDRPAAERFERLARVTPAAARVQRVVTEDPAEVQRFLEDVLAAGHEGVMAKSLQAPYEAGGRGASWLKIKRAHSLDLVVLAAEWGSGRRRGWLSNLHLGARDPSGGFVMLGKTFKGLTDELLEWQTRELLARERRRDGHVVFVEPELVVEIAFDDVQQSPQYPAGLALRFARVKGYRADKAAEEADTILSVQEIHERGAGGAAAAGS